MELSEAIDELRPAIVQIRFSASDLSENLRRRIRKPFISEVLGAGFLVNTDAYVITANHVIEECLRLDREIDAGQKDICVGISHQNTENLRDNIAEVHFDIIDQDEKHDIGLLKLRKNPFDGEVSLDISIGEKKVPLLYGTSKINPNRPREGVAIAISGYPFFEKSALVTNAGHVASSWILDRRDITRPEAPHLGSIPYFMDIYLGDVEVNPGNSGGPAYLVKDASIIGVCIASEGSPIWIKNGKLAETLGHNLFYSSGLTKIIPSRYVIEVLEINGISWIEVSDME